MNITRCVSSQLMTGLLTWRNPQGREENWFNGGRQSLGHYPTFAGKVIATEFGLALLATVAIVETVAYTVLAGLSLLLTPFTNRPKQFFVKLLESSSFTIIWTIADIFIYNIFFPNVMTREPFARYFAEMFNPTSITLYRFEDRLYVNDQEFQNENNPMLQPLAVEREKTQKSIDEGKKFLVNEVLNGADQQTKNDFMDMDPKMFMFVFSKSVFIYIFGSRKDAPIPDFFKKNTREAIASMRQKVKLETENTHLTQRKFSTEIIQEMERVLVDPITFASEEGIKVIAQEAFNELRAAASKELQDSLFGTRCWQEAVEKLEELEKSKSKELEKNTERVEESTQN